MTESRDAAPDPDGGRPGDGGRGHDGRGDQGGGRPERDGRLGWFASGGQYDKAVPSVQVIAALEAVTGEASRPPAEATLDEVTGMAVSWAAAEAHACAGKLAAIREIIRREGHGEPSGTGLHDLPRQWDIGVAHEVAAALGLSWQAAEPLLNFAYDLEARLPQVGTLLDSGIIHWHKAKIVADEFGVLDDQTVLKAQAKLLKRILTEDGRLRDDMTPARLRRLCKQIVAELDPEGCAKRREAAERDGARVEFFAEHGGSGALFATGLPPDEALRSEANIQKRAEEYRGAGIYPDDSMDMLRVLALIDTINGRSLADRIAIWNAGQDDIARRGAGDQERGRRNVQDFTEGRLVGQHAPGAGDGAGNDVNDHGDGGTGHSNGDEPGGSDGDDDGNGDGGDDAGGPAAGPAGAPAGQPDPGLPSLVHLTLPLITLEGRADRADEATRYGALDPDLVRRIGEAAAASQRSSFCLTVTDENGYAAYHGCARLIRGTGNTKSTGSRDGPGTGGWDLAPDRSRAGPDGGCGAWILTVPGGRQYRIDLYKVPAGECDHRYETDKYRPGKLLRHLVEVRDGECTSVSCSMPAWRCDFEHAVPYDRGGRTDACNAGMRSRRCHRVKQSHGWKVTSLRPGWHQWTAPSGRTYAKGPMEYPA